MFSSKISNASMQLNKVEQILVSSAYGFMLLDYWWRGDFAWQQVGWWRGGFLVVRWFLGGELVGSEVVSWWQVGWWRNSLVVR